MVSLDATIDGSEAGMTLAESLHASESAQSGEGGDTHHLHMELLRTLALLTPSQQRLPPVSDAGRGRPVGQGGGRATPNPARHAVRGHQTDPQALRGPWASRVFEGMNRHLLHRIDMPDLGSRNPCETRHLTFLPIR